MKSDRQKGKGAWP